MKTELKTTDMAELKTLIATAENEIKLKTVAYKDLLAADDATQKDLATAETALTGVIDEYNELKKNEIYLTCYQAESPMLAACKYGEITKKVLKKKQNENGTVTISVDDRKARRQRGAEDARKVARLHRQPSADGRAPDNRQLRSEDNDRENEGRGKRPRRLREEEAAPGNRMRKRHLPGAGLDLTAKRPNRPEDRQRAPAREQRGKAGVPRHARRLAELVVVESRRQDGERKRRQQQKQRQRLRENLQSRRLQNGERLSQKY